jgi:hypothetical protein
MNVYLKHIVILVIALLFGGTIFSQVSVKASVDRDKILIGEPIRLTLQAYTPLGEPISWFPLDSIPGFDFIEKGKLDTIENVDNKKLEQQLVITSFDSGQVAFPPLELKVGDNIYYTDSIMIDVAYINFDPAADYRDIKAIEEVEGARASWLPWAIGAAIILAIGLIAWFMLVRKKKIITTTTPEIKLSPYEEAMESLARLRQYDWTAPGATKHYYTELNDILRHFVQRRMKMASLEKTNDELILQLQQSDMGKENFTKLVQTLRMSDFVKFARYQPADTDNSHNWEVINSSIKTLHNLPEYNQTPGPVPTK